MGSACTGAGAQEMVNIAAKNIPASKNPTFLFMIRTSFL
jgi:hypothetical protein